MLHKKRKPSTFTSSSGNHEGHIATSKTKLHSKSTYFYRWIPISCSLALLLGLGIMINPAINSTEVAHAETVKNILTDETLNSTVDLIMGDVLNEQVEVESGKVAYISNEFTVRVTGAAKYSISVQAAEGASNNLIGRNTKEQILGVGENIRASSFNDNTWGYAIATSAKSPNNALYYDSLPAYGTVTKAKYSKDYAENENDTLKLVFAAKITDYKPSDHYETKALLSVVAEPLEIIVPTKIEPTGLVAKDGSKTILNMQDMTTDFCANKMNVSDTGTLMDTRDEKVYWVTKLADNNCWMTQNLDYDLSSTQTLTPANSDVTTNWTPSAAQSTKTGDLESWTADSAVVQSYDPGLYVLKHPAEKAYSSFCVQAASLAACDISVVQDVSKGWKPSSDKNMSAVLKQSDLTYNAHYTFGNYYSYAAAVAGTIPANETSAKSSICPKGWKLPVAGAANDAVSGSFKYLIDKTGVTDEAILKAPMYFFGTGWLVVDPERTYLTNIPNTRAYKSATKAYGNGAYVLNISISKDYFSIDPSFPHALATSYEGLPIRCLAK